eukprot:s3075_g6.t1
MQLPAGFPAGKQAWRSLPMTSLTSGKRIRMSLMPMLMMLLLPWAAFGVTCWLAAFRAKYLFPYCVDLLLVGFVLLWLVSVFAAVYARFRIAEPTWYTYLCCALGVAVVAGPLCGDHIFRSLTQHYYRVGDLKTLHAVDVAVDKGEAMLDVQGAQGVESWDRGLERGSNCYSISRPIRPICAMKYLDFVACFILTFLGSYPFLAVVNYKLRPLEDFRSCNETCSFIRNFGTEALPATMPATLNLNCSKYGHENCWVFTDENVSSTPVFVAVENGRNFSAACILHSTSWKNFWGKGVQGLLNALSAGTLKRSEMPSPAHVNQTFCEKESVREKIDNHLNTGNTIPIYKVGIVGWTALKILHDWGLLADMPESVTLSFGMVSWIFQLVATCAAFFWGSSAAEVFIARVSTETNDACFYELKPIETFTALGTPLLLLSLTHFKLKNLMLSVVNGDFLYYKAYDVPYRVVKATAAVNPLLTTGLCGDPGSPAVPYQQLTFRNMNRLSLWTRILHISYFCAMMLFICPFGFGNIFLRMTEVAVSHDFSLDAFGLIKVATLAAGSLLVLVCPAMLRLLYLDALEFEKLDEVSKKALQGRVWVVMSIRFSIFLVSASNSVVAWAVIQAVVRKEGMNGAEQRYEWYLCGISGGHIGFFLLQQLDLLPALDLLNSYTFQKFSAVCVCFPVPCNGNMDRPRDMLLDGSDRYASHAEQVLEVFSSQPEKAGIVEFAQSNYLDGMRSCKEVGDVAGPLCGDHIFRSLTQHYYRVGDLKADPSLKAHQ